VFAPDNGGVSAIFASLELRFLEDSGASCATSFALVNAATYGGDPADLTLAGVSGGAMYAAIVATEDDPLGAEYCLVQPEPVEPRALVLWEGDWVLAPWWDDALEADPDFYEDEWVLNQLPSGLESRWHVLSGPADRESRERFAVGDPFGTGDECGRPLAGEPGMQPTTGTMCRWFELRDPSGDLRREFGELGFFDDGWLTITEASVLFAEHLEAAGIDHTFEIFEDAEHEMSSPSGAAEAAYVDLIVNGTPR
jgi:acetyl esterase/lipase